PLLPLSPSIAIHNIYEQQLSHTKWSHPLLSGKLTLSGKDGNDAKLYQEKDVDNALKQLAEIEEENR
uniref:hypothetical protein n=1 Tax=Tychonema sp. LEGE 06208 TaxID=1828663 RepID=UPI001A09A171